jgi:hypothetical protein
MSRFYEHLNNFLLAVETDTARADSITEIKVKSDLFFKIANEMLRDTQDRSSGFINGMYMHLSKVKRYKLTTTVCDVTIVRDVEEEIQDKRQKIKQLEREIEELKNEK